MTDLSDQLGNKILSQLTLLPACQTAINFDKLCVIFELLWHLSSNFTKLTQFADDSLVILEVLPSAFKLERDAQVGVRFSGSRRSFLSSLPINPLTPRVGNAGFLKIDNYEAGGPHVIHHLKGIFWSIPIITHINRVMEEGTD